MAIGTFFPETVLLTDRKTVHAASALTLVCALLQGR
jgi:hypothetical protein